MPLPYIYIHAQYRIHSVSMPTFHIAKFIFIFEFTMHRQTRVQQSLSSYHRKMIAIYYCSKCWWSLSFSTAIAALKHWWWWRWWLLLCCMCACILMMLSSITSHYSCVSVCVLGPNEKRRCKYNSNNNNKNEWKRKRHQWTKMRIKKANRWNLLERSGNKSRRIIMAMDVENLSTWKETKRWVQKEKKLKRAQNESDEIHTHVCVCVCIVQRVYTQCTCAW